MEPDQPLQKIKHLGIYSEIRHSKWFAWNFQFILKNLNKT